MQLSIYFRRSVQRQKSDKYLCLMRLSTEMPSVSMDDPAVFKAFGEVEQGSYETNPENCTERIGVGRMDKVSKSLKVNSDEFLPPVADYFALALAFAALGLLLKRVTVYKLLPLVEASTSVQIIELDKILKGGLELLTGLTWKARAFEDAVSSRTIVNDEVTGVIDALRSEKLQLQEKIAHTLSKVQELKNQRAEDAKANEKVVSIFATHEQGWKNERKKLRHEVQKLRYDLQRNRKEMDVSHRRMLTTGIRRENGCEECSRKETLVMDLKDRLGEQEFLMMATMEEAKAEQQERNELAGKLVVADDAIAELRQKFTKEVEERALEFRMHQAVLSELKSKQRHMEKERSQLLEEYESFKRERIILLEEKKCTDELIERLSLELTKFREDSHQKEEIISAMLRKANAETEEKHDLKCELTIAKAKRKHAESGKEKLKRLVEEKACSTSGKDVYRPRSSLGSRTESGIDLVAEMQTLHDTEVQSLQNVFGEEINILRNRIRLYQDRVAEVEESILLYMADAKDMFTNGEQKSVHGSGSKEIITLEEPMEMNVLPTRQFQLSAARDLLVHYMDIDHTREQETDKWKKLYFAAKASAEMLQKEKENTVCIGRNLRFQDWLEVEKARYTMQLERRHWQEIDAFERQMRAKDERMEAFRWQLLKMEKEAYARLEKIEALNKDLHSLAEEKLKLESLLEERELEVKAYRDQLSQCEKCEVHVDLYEGIKANKYETETLHMEIDSLKKLLKEKELEHESAMTKVVEEAEVELQDKDFKLAVIEAKLVQAQLQYEKEKKAKEKISCDVIKEKASLENFVRNHLSSEMNVTDALGAVCLEVERLSNKIAEGQEQMMQMEQQHEEQLKELADQAGNVFKSGSQVKRLKDLISTTEEVSEQDCVLKQESELSRPNVDEHFFQQEAAVDKFVSNVKPDCIPLEASSGEPSDPMKAIKVNRECMSPRFASGYPSLEEKELSNKLVEEGVKPNSLNVESRNGYPNYLQKVMFDFDKFNLAEQQITDQSCLQLIPVNTSLPQEETFEAKSVAERGGLGLMKDAEALSMVAEVKEIEQLLNQLEKRSKMELRAWLKDSEYLSCTVGGKGEAGQEVQSLHLKGTSMARVAAFKKQARKYAVLAETMNELHKRVQAINLDRTTDCSIYLHMHELEAQISAAVNEGHKLQHHIDALGQQLEHIQIVTDSTSVSFQQCGPASQGIQKCLETVKIQLLDVHQNLEMKLVRMMTSLEEAASEQERTSNQS